MQLATPEAYRRDPAFVWSWYEHRFGVAAAAEPNPGHRAIAELEQLLPKVVVITQNIDGLHQRAGSSHVIELHGTMHSFRCIEAGTAATAWDDFADQEEKPPRCPECGDYLRPEVVWFGEGLPPDALNAAQQLSAGCDVMLVVGTSGVVYPAAAMPMIAREAGATVIDVNPERDALARSCDLFLRGPGGEVLPELVLAVRAHLERRPEPLRRPRAPGTRESAQRQYVRTCIQEYLCVGRASDGTGPESTHRARWGWTS